MMDVLTFSQTKLNLQSVITAEAQLMSEDMQEIPVSKKSAMAGMCFLVLI